MEEQDTTVQPDVQAAPDMGQPATDTSQVDTPVTDTPSEPSDTSAASQEAPAAPEADEKLQKFASSQGIELDSPSAIKAAQIAMKARSEATKNYKRSTELEKATNITQDQLPEDASPVVQENARIRNLELQIGIQGWKASNPDKLELEGEMVKVLSDPIKKQLVQEGYLSLDDVYNLARASAPDTTADVKSQAKQEALQSLAHKQQAAVPTGHATTSATPKKKSPQEMTIAEMEATYGFAER